MENRIDDLYIFEMANNHQGSVQHGIRIIREMGKIARKCNVKAAVKLQYRDIDNFIHPNYKGRKDVKHIERFESTKLTFDQFNELVEAIRDENLIPMSTPFDEKGVEWCNDQGLDIIKIASCSSMDWPLLEAAVDARKQLIISTGGKNLSDIDKIYNFLTHRNARFAFMHCVAEYPAPDDQIQLDFIDKMRKRYYQAPIGYSGHEDPQSVLVPMMAVAKGVRIFERHVGVEAEAVKLNAYTMNPQQTMDWVRAIEKAKEICSLKGRDDKYVTQEEIDSLRSLMRGVYAKRDIKCNDLLEKEHVFFAMPCLENQMTSGDFYEECKATQEYAANDPIVERKRVTDINMIRSVVHEAKGMLYEAGIILGNNVEVELSHHYGINHVRQTGAVIINVINREYCKKIIVILPGQFHPNHMHKKKEETFQLLYGELKLQVGDISKVLVPGDIQTIEREMCHSFSSERGAIFEEISTTHIKNDSYYEDAKINKMDIMERKTIIRNW